MKLLNEVFFMRNRIILILAIIIAIFLFLIYRLFYLQIIDNENMLKKVASQRFISVPIKDIRGTIYDRNLIPLTDNDEQTNLVIIPQLIKNPERTAKIISQNSYIRCDELLKNIKHNKPAKYIISYNEAVNIKNQIREGIIVTKISSRYGESSIARHVIGYISNDNTGLNGIEKGYDRYLKTKGHQYIGVLSDAVKQPLIGFGYRAVETYSEYSKNNVKLTLDYHYQRIIEETFDKYSYDGAAVLLDTNSGDILAMVSRPNYNQNNVSKYFNSPNKELINKALYPYNLGSIFKIVIAYAALEKGIASEDDIFYCPGYIVVDGQLKKCASYNSGGHGRITFIDAFAHSCNTAFIKVGLQLGYNKIIETARRFGLGQSLGLDVHGLAEDPGLVQYKKYVSKREVANISIGQGEILVTPLQIANLINIVANDGVKKDVNIVDSIVDDEGRVLKKIKYLNQHKVLSSEYIKVIKKMMTQVVLNGTGTKANMEEYGGAAGKSSSAETGIYHNGEQVIHAWFGGYFPRTNPKYTLVVIIENGKTGSQTAAPLFGEIAKKILEINEKNK